MKIKKLTEKRKVSFTSHFWNQTDGPGKTDAKRRIGIAEEPLSKKEGGSPSSVKVSSRGGDIDMRRECDSGEKCFDGLSRRVEGFMKQRATSKGSKFGSTYEILWEVDD